MRLGGSRTADNLNDHAAMAVDPHLVGQIMTGNWHGAVRTALSAGQNVVSGNTPAVRKEVANILLAERAEHLAGKTGKDGQLIPWPASSL
jgi:uncharacterized NAD-dependent epimerase/dehydratase family protein